MKYNACIETKENNIYGFRKSSTKLTSKPRNSQISLTQSLFPSKKNSLKNITNNIGLCVNDFYQTLSFGFGNEWTRP